MDRQPAQTPLGAVLARKQLFQQKLVASLAKAGTHAKRNYTGGLILLLISVGASALATILGLFRWAPEIVGSISMLSGFATLLATTFKLESKGNWYYEKRTQLFSLYNRLSFTGPLETENDEIALLKHMEGIASEWSNLNVVFENKWRNKLGIDTGQLNDREIIQESRK